MKSRWIFFIRVNKIHNTNYNMKDDKIYQVVIHGYTRYVFKKIWPTSKSAAPNNKTSSLRNTFFAF